MFAKQLILLLILIVFWLNLCELEDKFNGNSKNDENHQESGNHETDTNLYEIPIDTDQYDNDEHKNYTRQNETDQNDIDDDQSGQNNNQTDVHLGFINLFDPETYKKFSEGFNSEKNQNEKSENGTAEEEDDEDDEEDEKESKFHNATDKFKKYRDKLRVNKSYKKCYAKLGCFGLQDVHFEDLLDFYELPLLPVSPDILNATFNLFTEDIPLDKPIVFQYDFDSELMKKHYKRNSETIFIIHGFQDKYKEGNWNAILKDVILKSNLKRKVIENVFIVDWHKGCDKGYSYALSNVKITAKAISYFIKKLFNELFIQSISSVHLTGHSLGAQICGFIGKDFPHPKIPTITALDPAGPGFYKKNPKKRLAKTDALSVSAIHTDAGVSLLEGFGIKDPLGHYDYYTNSGANQPGCVDNPTQRTMKSIKNLKVSCSHHRAVDLISDFDYHENDCLPIAYGCPNYGAFLEGRCAKCGTGTELTCREMALEYDLLHKNPNIYNVSKFYIANNPVKPFHVFHYQIIFRLKNNAINETVSGQLDVEFHGHKNGNKNLKVKIGLQNVYFASKIIYSYLLLTRTKLKKPYELDVTLMKKSKKEYSKFEIEFIEINYMSHFSEKKRLENSDVLCVDFNATKQQVEEIKKFVSCSYLSQNQTIYDHERGYKLHSDLIVPIEKKEPITNEQGITGYKVNVYD